MLHQLVKFRYEQPFVLACSGGVDSMAIADFFQRGSKNFSLAYFDHGTGNSIGALPVIEKFARNKVTLHVGHIKSPKPPDLSPEEYWRNERYAWLHSFELPVVTCHHLNDVAETWLMSAMHGQPKLISPILVGEKRIVYRPFLTNTKQELIDWCVRHHVKWFEDTSNTNVYFPRNRVRHNILPEVLKINPGFLKVMRKKYLNSNTILGD